MIHRSSRRDLLIVIAISLCTWIGVARAQDTARYPAAEWDQVAPAQDDLVVVHLARMKSVAGQPPTGVKQTQVFHLLSLILAAAGPAHQ